MFLSSLNNVKELCRLGKFLQQATKLRNERIILHLYFVWLRISHVNYVNTFNCICNCVSTYMFTLRNIDMYSNKLYAFRNKQTNKKPRIHTSIT